MPLEQIARDQAAVGDQHDRGLVESVVETLDDGNPQPQGGQLGRRGSQPSSSPRRAIRLRQAEGDLVRERPDARARRPRTARWPRSRSASATPGSAEAAVPPSPRAGPRVSCARGSGRRRGGRARAGRPGRSSPSSSSRKGVPSASCASSVTALRPLDRHEHTLHREAALVGRLQLVARIDDHRVDGGPRPRPRPRSGTRTRGEARPPGCRRGRRRARRAISACMRATSRRRSSSNVLHLLGPQLQHRVGPLADLGQRKPPPRLVLGAQLLVDDLRRAPRSQRGQCIQRLCGSTSTTAVRPALPHRRRRRRERLPGSRRESARPVGLGDELRAMAPAQPQDRRRTEQIGVPCLTGRGLRPVPRERPFSSCNACMGASASGPETTMRTRCRNGG